MSNNPYTLALTFYEIRDFDLRVGLVGNSKVVLSKRLCFQTLRLHTSLARRFGCYAFVSRAALLPLAYDEGQFPLLRWCKEAVSVRVMINRGHHPFMWRQKGTKVRHKSMAACSLPCVPCLMISLRRVFRMARCTTMTSCLVSACNLKYGGWRLRSSDPCLLKGQYLSSLSNHATHSH